MAGLLQRLVNFGSDHLIPLCITGLLVAYSLARRKLTIDGILAAVTTALIQMSFPSSVSFNLLVVFFMSGVIGTRINHKRKASLTHSSTGGSGGEGARNSSQVLANSGVASALVLCHILQPRILDVETATIGIVG